MKEGGLMEKFVAFAVWLLIFILLFGAGSLFTHMGGWVYLADEVPTAIEETKKDHGYDDRWGWGR